MQDNLGDEVKYFESLESTRKLDLTSPICVRIDGRNFSKLTKNMKKPFDDNMSNIMMETTKWLVEKTNALIGYVQSDEITLIFFKKPEEVEFLFSGRIQKLNSILSGMTSSKFCIEMMKHNPELIENHIPHFDCRIWNVPTKQVAAMTVLWRSQDARRNAINTIAHSIIDHSKLQNKNQKQLLQLIKENNISFEKDFTLYEKHGAFFQKKKKLMKISEEIWNKIPEKNKPNNQYVNRSVVERLNIGYFGDVINQVPVIFDSETPIFKINKGGVNYE